MGSNLLVITSVQSGRAWTLIYRTSSPKLRLESRSFNYMVKAVGQLQTPVAAQRSSMSHLLPSSSEQRKGAIMLVPMGLQLRQDGISGITNMICPWALRLGQRPLRQQVGPQLSSAGLFST